jgi:hypothetical protein
LELYTKANSRPSVSAAVNKKEEEKQQSSDDFEDGLSEEADICTNQSSIPDVDKFKVSK